MEVGIALSNGLFDLGLNEENVSLLEEATQTFGKVKSKWAWLRLGVIHLNAEKANEAVNAFHACIRSDINDWWVMIAKFQNYCFLIDYCSYKMSIFSTATFGSHLETPIVFEGHIRLPLIPSIELSPSVLIRFIPNTVLA
jgi:hypothetical protein